MSSSQLRNGTKKIINRAGLWENQVDAGFLRLLPIFLNAPSTHKNHPDTGIVLLHCLGQIPTAHLRHPEVCDQDVDRLLLQDSESFLSACRSLDEVSLVFKDRLMHLDICFIIIDINGNPRDVQVISSNWRIPGPCESALVEQIKSGAWIPARHNGEFVESIWASPIIVARTDGSWDSDSVEF